MLCNIFNIWKLVLFRVFISHILKSSCDFILINLFYYCGIFIIIFFVVKTKAFQA